MHDLLELKAIANIETETLHGRIRDIHEVMSPNLENEYEAFQNIYNENSSNSSYRGLKRRYKQELLDRLVDFKAPKPKGKDLLASRNIIYRSFAAFKILAANSKSEAALTFGQELLSMSKRYGLSAISFEILEYCLRYHLAQASSRTKINNLERDRKKYQELARIESEAFLFYANLGYLLKSKNTSAEDVIDKCNNFINTYYGHKQRVESFEFQKVFFNISCVAAYYQGDFVLMKETAQNAIHFFETTKIHHPETLRIFQRHMIRVLFIKKEYEKASEVLQEIISATKRHLPNWFNSQFMLFKNLLYLEKYKEAIQVYRSVKSNTHLKRLPSSYKDFWDIAEAYVNYLILSNVVKVDFKVSRFRINKFINSRTDLTKSKKKYNIQLIIAQILFYFHDNNYDKIEEQITAISRYTSKYLKRDETYRSQVFIKMLVEIPRQKYSQLASRRHTEKFQQRLKNNPLKQDISLDNIEIIPYERLWEMIMENLKR